VTSDDKPKQATPEDVSISDPDLPGLSSVFSTTRSGLKPLRRRRSRRSDDRAPADVPAADEAPSEEAPGEDVPGEDVDAEPAEGTDSFEQVPDGPAAPPDSEALDVPEPGVTPPVDGIQLRAGLSLVDTAEMPVHRPPEEPTTLEDPGTEPDEPEAAPAAVPTGPPVPPSRPRPTSQPARPPAALMDDSSARRAVGPAPSSSNWLLYLIVLVVALGLIGVLVVTFLEL